MIPPRQAYREERALLQPVDGLGETSACECERQTIGVGPRGRLAEAPDRQNRFSSVFLRRRSGAPQDRRRSRGLAASSTAASYLVQKTTSDQPW